MASILDDLTYLEPTFDPNSITIPQLRNILGKHEVRYPSSAKKTDLVNLFNEQVAPQGQKLLKARARTKRSTRGIKDVPSSQASTVDDEEELPLPPSTVKRTSRRTTRAPTAEDGAVEPNLPKIRGKTPSRGSSSKHARASDAEIDERPAPRRTRHSVTPAIKDESEPEAWHRHDDIESPFSAENPFQSGSSPPAPIDRERRRKTLGVEHKEKRKSDAHRRRTVQPNAEQYDQCVTVPTKRTFDMPVAPRRVKEEPVEETDVVQPGEEFTPEEQLELEQEQQITGQELLPPRRRKQRQSKGVLKAGVGAMLATVLAGFAGVWRQEKLEIGYCGIGRESASLGGVEIPTWASDILLQCEPCPPHAYCYANLHTVCEPGFILRPHPLSLGGAVPLPPTCAPDTEKAKRVTAVTDRTVEILRERRAKSECGDLVDEKGKNMPVEMKEDDLKKEMSSKRRKDMSQEEFEDLWNSAIGEIVSREEVVENREGVTGYRTLTSTSLAKLPFGCFVRRWLRLSLEQYIGQLIGLFALLFLAYYGKYSITYNRETEAKAKQLASSVFDRLADHAAWHIYDPSRTRELGISMTQLRDDILRKEFSAARRKKLWEKVQKKVEHNSNVRAAVREQQSGDVARMWEWIGPTQQLIDDGRGSSGRRDSSRFSLGPVIGSSPPDRATPSWENSRNEMKELKSWDESRPYY